MTKIAAKLAAALWKEGLCLIPTAGGAEKRPFAAWKEYQQRMPTRDEVERWFATPRPGGIVCGAVSAGLEVIDLDTPEAFEAFKAKFGGEVPCERSPHGGHAWYRCDEIGRNARPADKVDTRGEGGFCVVYEPAVLLGGGKANGAARPTNSCVPRVSPEKRAQMLAFVGESGGGQDAKGARDAKDRAQTVRDSLVAAGWRSLGVHGSREDFSRPGAAHPQKCDASLFEGQTFKVWSTAAQSDPPAELADEPERVKPPILTFDELKSGHPDVPPPLVDGLLRRGETMLVFGKPKVQKSLRMLALAAAVANGGVWAGFRCAKGRVLVIDNETHPAILADRFAQICAKAGCATDGVDFLPVWDHEYSVEDMMRDAAHLAGYALIIFDILARGLPDWCESESDNRQCAKVWGCVQKTAALTGAAAAVVHHSRKAATADIVSDPSGAGWTRYASTVASLSKRDKEPGVWLEAVCRSFASPQPRRL